MHAAIAHKGGCVANHAQTPTNFTTAAERWPDHDAYLQEVFSPTPPRLEDLDLTEDLFQHPFIPTKVLLLTYAQIVTIRWKLTPFETNTGISLLSPTGDRKR